MGAALAAVAVYVALALIATAVVAGSKPTACPRGHTDLYNLCGWRCRVCDAKKYNRKRR